jgi:hypothetical protein
MSGMIRRRDLLLLLTRPPPPATHDDYRRARREMADDRTRRLARWRAGDRSRAFRAECQRAVAQGAWRLSRFWLGTRWGLGLPQVERPGDGRVNCGTFVGRLLADAGFRVAVRRLQRQPSALIARAFATPDRLQRFSRTPFPEFLAAVHAMGPGLFIIGLDLHVGLLLRLAGELRFVHASYLTATVVDEPAAQAVLIEQSAYRVVGKALGHHNLEQWLTGAVVPVIGDH